MERPSLEFLFDSIAVALLERYGVEAPPVPIREFLRFPPGDLARDLSLTESLPFGEAFWLRLGGGQGAIFSNPELPDPQYRHALAAALFTGLCSSAGGLAAGLPPVASDQFYASRDMFAGQVLMPEPLLPANWSSMPVTELADLFQMPLELGESRLGQLLWKEARASRPDRP